jgi:Transposase DDE domain.
MFPAAFQPFIEQRPIGVMARVIVERFFEPEHLDELFRKTAVEQYERSLLFSSVVDLMHSVVLGAEPSVFAAFRKRRHNLPVTDDSIYNKLKAMELGVSEAVVRDSAQRAAVVLDELKARHDPWLPGYHARVLDGNHLSATEHRLEPLRGTWAAPLPGRILVVMDPELGLAINAFVTPDGHANERTLLDSVLETVREKELWIADRNFCTRKFLFTIAEKQAFFLIRQHGTIPGCLKGERRFVGESSTGKVYEQAIELNHGDMTRTIRRITVELVQPTRDGDMELHLFTNLPEEVKAVECAELYRKRWSIETLFYEVTQTLQCEVKTLCYPPAALFVFCLALMAANAVAVMKGAVRAAHGAEEADAMSAYYMALEIKQVHEGMMIALPPDEWAIFRTMSVATFAVALKKMAAHMNLSYYRKSKRGPKKPPPTMDKYQNGGHVSTHKLLKKKKL